MLALFYITCGFVSQQLASCQSLGNSVAGALIHRVLVGLVPSNILCIGLWPNSGLAYSIMDHVLFAAAGVTAITQNSINLSIYFLKKSYRFGASDFSHFFNMAAYRNYTTTSSYRAIVGLTKRSPVIDDAK